MVVAKFLCHATAMYLYPRKKIHIEKKKIEIINHAAKSLPIGNTIPYILPPNLCYREYTPGAYIPHYMITTSDKVWLQKSGPWTITRVYPKKANFKIVDNSGKIRVAHRNKLSPVIEKCTEDDPCCVLSDEESALPSTDGNESLCSSKGGDGGGGDGETERRRDGETGRRGDGETGRRGDGETGRRGDGETGRRGDGETGRKNEHSRNHSNGRF